MIKKIKKIANNIFSFRAIKVLGLFNYIRYLVLIILNVGNIIRDGNFKSVDNKLGKFLKKFRYRGKTICFDCNYIDNYLNKRYSFGLIRELLIRDCYLKFMPKNIFFNSKTILDLGCNRGLFSIMMSKTSDFIISVDGDSCYEEIIKYNFKSNLFDNFAFEECLVGGVLDNYLFRNSNYLRTYNIPHFFKKYNLKSLDLLKIDIEGSEFDLFKGNCDWLQKTKAIVMEVHTNEGDPNIILKKLSDYNFSLKVADKDMNLIKGAKNANFIYALSRSFF